MGYAPGETLEARRMLAFGALDTSFGDGGIVRAREAPATTAAIDVMRDGRIVTARIVDGEKHSGASLWVTRLLPNGKPDPTFGGAANGQPAGTPRGTVQVKGARLPGNVVDLRVTKQGKIILAGTFEEGGDVSSGDLTVVRLNRDGTRDVTFGGTSRGHSGASPGVAFVDFGNTRDLARGLAVNADGRIAVVGTAYQQQPQQSNSTSAVAAVFRTDGTFDTSFNETGKSVWGMAGRSAHATLGYDGEAAAFGRDGELIVAGARNVQTSDGGVSRDWALHNISPAGPTSPANPFATGGASIGQSLNGAINGAAKDVAVLADGSVLVAGESGGALVIAKVLADGTIDRAFGNEGMARTALPSDPPAPAGADVGRCGAARIAVLPDGRFYVLAHVTTRGGAGGGAGGAEHHAVFIARFMSGGTADPAFGGLRNIDGGADPCAADVGVQGDDAIVLAALAPAGAAPAVGAVGLQLRKLQGGAGSRLSKRGTLEVSGTSTGDTITITRRPKDGRVLVRAASHVRSYAPSRVKRIQVYSQGGNDTVTIGKDVRGTFVDAGPGRDTVTGGDGNDTIVGGPGGDRLVGGNGNDVLSGGGGKDYLLGSAGHDKLSGGAGVDTLNGAGGNDRFFADGDGAADAIRGGSGADTAAQNVMDFFKDVEHFLATVAD